MTTATEIKTDNMAAFATLALDLTSCGFAVKITTDGGLEITDPHITAYATQGPFLGDWHVTRITATTVASRNFDEDYGVRDVSLWIRTGV